MKENIKPFEISISSLSTNTINFKKATLFINLNQEDQWSSLDNDVLASYKDILIKIQNHFNNKIFYVFLTNSDFIIRNNKIEISTLSNINILVSDKNNFNLKENKANLKELSHQIKYYEAYKNLGLELEELIKLNSLESKQYQLKLKQLLYLVNYEGDINE
ncbi:MSC_0621 family F1-like ATPase epsilon subunit [Mycoplasma zalophi]|uniref:Uncharacterized protein n=1 Tax=Mycoplasma zalophi TaxID=191287 RepID=A0ABS6DPN9_9MOLU|nr:hypothetical protein [Mycoplasma zalophi]MBU4690938.1 hypothetical protein [Mycoplasma zalophi]MBU4692282.1 hypothetical protein [Mycoplasma zalophi]